MAKAVPSVVVALSFLTSGGAFAAPPQTPAPATARLLGDRVVFGYPDKVEVREGDTWSPATLLKREGRKFQIRYDDGTEEWITGDRMRPRGAGAKAAAATEPATRPATRPVSRVPWMAGQKVEVKWGGNWSKASVVRRQGDWSLVKYESGLSEEWVEPWRIRKVGSTEDTIPMVHPNLSAGKGGPPAPSPAPKPSTDEHASFRDYSAAAAAASPEPAPADVARDDGGAGAVGVSLSGVRKVEIDQAPAAPPTLKPAPVVEVKSSRGRIPLPGSTINGKIVGVSLAPGAAQAFVGHTNTVKGVSRGAVERVDLAAGKSMNVWPIDQDRRLGDVSGDGRFFTAVSTHTHGEGREHFDLWAVQGAAKKTLTLTPFESEKWPGREVAETFLSADGSRLAVHNGRGRLVVFDTADGKPQYQLDVGVFGTYATDAGRTCLLAKEDKDVVFIDFASGGLLGSAPAAQGNQLVLLSPDNARVFTTQGATIRASDVTGAGAASEVTLSKPPQTLVPVDKSLVLVDDGLLVDVDKHAYVWRFEGKAEGARLLPGGLLVFLPPEGRGALGVAHLLSPAVKAAAQSAAADNQLVLRAGTSVSVAYELNGAADVARQRIMDGSKKSLEAARLKVADGQGVRIVYHTNPGPAVERQYRSFGFGAEPPAVQTRSFASQVSGVRIEVAGNVVWKSEWTFKGDLYGGSNNDLDGAIADGRSQSIASLGSTQLPQYLLAPAETLKLGSSKLHAEVGK